MDHDYHLSSSSFLLPSYSAMAAAAAVKSSLHSFQAIFTLELRPFRRPSLSDSEPTFTRGKQVLHGHHTDHDAPSLASYH